MRIQFDGSKFYEVPQHVYKEAVEQGFARLAYRYGMTKPHHPVPVTLENADIATWYRNDDAWWSNCHD